MRIIIELPTWIGDCVMVSPALINLIEKKSISSIDFIGNRNALELYKNFPFASKFIIHDKRYATYLSYRKLGFYDFAISFRSSIRSKVLLKLIKAKRTKQFSKRSFKSGHQVEKYNNFINSTFQFNSLPRRLKLFFDDSNPFKSLKKPLVGINPGAAYGSAKRWPADKFAHLAERLSKDYHIVIFGGKDEEDIAFQIEGRLKEIKCRDYTNLAGSTSIAELVTSIHYLDIFITGDSGPMHIAAAEQIPTISIFGPTISAETSQWLNASSEIIQKNLECQPCMQRVCPLKHHNCMKMIDVEDVIGVLKKIVI